MKCMNFKIRSKKYEKYFYCSKKRKNISFIDCKNCPYKEYKKVNKIKNKSNKLRNLENKRYSILTNDLRKCYVCNKNPKEHMHEIYGGRNRKVSMLNGLCIPICFECHRKTEEDMKLDESLKRECREKYLETHTEDEFIDLIGKFYTEERI